MNDRVDDRSPVEVFAAEKPPTANERRLVTWLTWPTLVAAYAVLGVTFWMWGGEGTFLDDILDPLRFGSPGRLLFGLVILLPAQLVGGWLLHRNEILPGIRRWAYVLSATVAGIVLGGVGAVAMVPDEAGLGGLLVWFLFLAYGLSFLFALALLVRFNN